MPASKTPAPHLPEAGALSAEGSKTRNLVVLRAGENSLHPQWFTPERNFHLVVDCYAGDPGIYEGTCDDLHHGLGKTGAEAQFRLLTDNPHYLDDYDFIWMPDDDIEATTAQVNELFRLHRQRGYDLAQPALSRSSFYTLSITVQHDGLSVRQTNFVESMVPIWTSEALRKCLPTLEGSTTGWGLDVVWGMLLQKSGGRIAIYDDVVVTHTRPVASRGNQGASDYEAQREVDRLIKTWMGAPESVPAATVLAAWDTAGAAVLPTHLFDHLSRAFPHSTVHPQTTKGRHWDLYGQVMRRSLLRVASSQVRQRQVLAEAAARPIASNARRNLVVLRAGDHSLHPAWFTDEREFDLVVDAHGSRPESYIGTCDRLFTGLGETGASAQFRLFTDNPGLLTDYDAIWIADDDIEATTQTINTLFRLHRELGFDLAQPALTTDSYFTHSLLLQHEGFSVRQVNFVETMVPLFTREALSVCLPTLAESRSAWGLEVAWQALLRPLGGRSAVYDCVSVRHTRPVGLQSVQGGSPEDAVAEQAALVRKYNAPDPSIHLVEAAWDDAFMAVAPAALDSAILTGFPRPSRQAPQPWDFHALRFGAVPAPSSARATVPA